MSGKPEGIPLEFSDKEQDDRKNKQRTRDSPEHT